MCAISGFQGLKPTLDIIKFTKTIAIANKESIICGWNLIKKDLRKYKTYFNLLYIPAPETIYQDIFKLKPGHYLSNSEAWGQSYLCTRCYQSTIPKDSLA